jgi:hypothetical protein
MLSNADAAPLSPSPEDRYIATRDAAIERFSSIYDAGRFDDAAKKGEETARADLQAQMRPHGSSNLGLAPLTHQHKRRPNRRIGVANGGPVSDQRLHGTSQSFRPANIRVLPQLRESPGGQPDCRMGIYRPV